MNILHRTRARAGAALLAALALAAGVAACDSDSNAWSDLPTGGSNHHRDAGPPRIEILSPTPAGRVAVGDSVLVSVEVSDDVGVDSVRLTGFSLRGSAELGTQVRVERFATKVLALGSAERAVRDTTLARFLVATADSLAEDIVYVTALARDVAGRVHADTVVIAIGGPRLRVISPASGTAARAGTALRVHLQATDSIGRIEGLGVRMQGGGADLHETVRIDPAEAMVDTILTLPLPAGASGEATLYAYAATASGDTTVHAPITLNLAPAAGDNTPPVVTFSLDAAERMEVGDTISVMVLATDSTQVGRVGVTIRPVRRLASGDLPQPVWTREMAGDSGVFRVALGDLGAVEPADTSYRFRLELTAFAVDTAGNCATSNVEKTPLSQACVPERPAAGAEVVGTRGGRVNDVRVVRGATRRVAGAENRLADLVADPFGRRLFVSNLTRNRVEVLPFGAEAFTSPVSVGSEPWGLAIGRGGDTMYVANSGGTNISVVPLRPTTLRESARIHTSNIRLYAVEFDTQTDSVTALTEHDYSDRPQFLGQVASGQVLYSTKPTDAAADGTIRIFDARKDTTLAYNRGSEIVTQYAWDGKVEGKAVVVNALEVDVTTDGFLVIWPRRIEGGGIDPAPVIERPTEASEILAQMRDAGETDTRIDLRLDIADIGLSDTTFVAVSRDNRAVAFGEGGVDPGRVFYFQSYADALVTSNVATDDLIGNAAERVVGLALNGDGTLGVARGRQSYFFNNSLRLQGVVPSGMPSGGVAVHPLNGRYPTSTALRRAFVSGIDADGVPYVDIVDSYSFRQLRRIPIRDAITGSLSGNSAKWHEVSTHLYTLPLGWSHVMHAVNLKRWNSLDPKVRAFLEKHPVAFPVAIVDTYDPPRDFPTPRGLPQTCLVAPDGRLVKTFLGPVTAAELERAIEAAGGPAPGQAG